MIYRMPNKQIIWSEENEANVLSSIDKSMKDILVQVSKFLFLIKSI